MISGKKKASRRRGGTFLVKKRSKEPRSGEKRGAEEGIGGLGGEWSIGTGA